MKNTSYLWLMLLSMALLCSESARAVIDSFEFSSPAHAQRYHALIDELRCPVCLSSNLSGSDSPISADLRREVYRQIEAGADDAAIRDYMYQRYGDYILYRPRLTPWVVLLYAVPVLLVGLGILVILRLLRARAAAPALDAAATAQQSALLSTLLTQHGVAVNAAEAEADANAAIFPDRSTAPDTLRT